MQLLQLCLAGLTGGGLWLLLTDTLILPSLRTQKIYRESRRQKVKGGLVRRLAAPLAKRLEPHIFMNPYKKERLDHTLSTIGEERNAVQYIASLLAQSLLLYATGLMTLPIYPLLPAVFIGGAVFAYFRSMKEPEKRLREKREKIERELPRMASTISNSLAASRDVVKILEHYRRVCGPELAEELDITLADMKTGNAENALRGLENRIGSTKLSELVRGLLSVLRGEDQQLYFYTKNSEFRREGIEHQKQEIQKRPDKLIPYIAVIVACFFVMVLYVVGYEIVQKQVGL